MNYSSVFTEEEVLADANKAMSIHDDVVPDSLIVERVDSSSSFSSNDSVLKALCDDVFYPVHEDKDWLKKMMTESEVASAAPTSRKRVISRASSVVGSGRKTLRLYDQEKAEPTRGDDEDEQLEFEDTETGMEQEPSSGSSEQLSPQPSTSKKSSKPLTTPKERFKGKVFQHPCPDCGKAFRTNQLLKSHRSECVKCPTCGKWRDQRHADKCKDNKLCPVCDHWYPENHKCRGKKLLKGKQILCAYCQRAITEGHMYNHMRSVHGMAWSKGAYPECMPVVSSPSLLPIPQFRMKRQPLNVAFLYRTV